MTFQTWCDENQIRPSHGLLRIAESVQRQLDNGIDDPAITGDRVARSVISRWVQARKGAYDQSDSARGI